MSLEQSEHRASQLLLKTLRVALLTRTLQIVWNFTVSLRLFAALFLLSTARPSTGTACSASVKRQRQLFQQVGSDVRPGRRLQFGNAQRIDERDTQRVFVQKWHSKHALPWGRLWFDPRKIEKTPSTENIKTSKTTENRKVDLKFGGARTFRSAQTHRKCHQRQPIGQIFVTHWLTETTLHITSTALLRTSRGLKMHR